MAHRHSRQAKARRKEAVKAAAKALLGSPKRERQFYRCDPCGFGWTMVTDAEPSLRAMACQHCAGIYMPFMVEPEFGDA